MQRQITEREWNELLTEHEDFRHIAPFLKDCREYFGKIDIFAIIGAAHNIEYGRGDDEGGARPTRMLNVNDCEFFYSPGNRNSLVSIVIQIVELIIMLFVSLI